MIAAALAAMLLAAPAAPAADPDPACEVKETTACGIQTLPERLAKFGQRPAEALTAEGVEGVRVWFVDGYGRDEVAVSILKAPNGPPTLELRGPPFDETPVRVFGGEASPWTWRSVLALTEEVAASPVEKPFQVYRERPAADGSGDTEVSICMHSWRTFTETIRAGQVTRRFRSTCEADLVSDGAFAMAEAAVLDLPGCRYVSADYYRNDVKRLYACYFLRGEDPESAAQVFNRLSREVFSGPTAASEATLRGYFAVDARLEQHGLAPLAGPGPIADRWRDLMKGRESAGFDYGEIVGDGEKVRVTGEVVLWALDDKSYEAAPSTQDWRRDDDGEWRVVAWTIGAYRTEVVPQ